MFFSCEKAEEGIALVDLSGEDSRVQPQLRRHPKSSRPLVPMSYSCVKGVASLFPMDSLTSRVAITDKALVAEVNRLTGSSPLSLGPQSPK